jgi:hypothetical protein
VGHLRAFFYRNLPALAIPWSRVLRDDLVLDAVVVKNLIQRRLLLRRLKVAVLIVVSQTR